MVTTIVAFVVVLGFLIFVHELGHFVTAKRAGLTVEEFGFGFPPRILSFKRGDTRYSINLIPFGGFVKVLGEGGEDDKNHKSFASRSVGVRTLIVAAGIIMNYIAAMILLMIVNAIGVTVAVDDRVTFPDNATVSPQLVTVAIVEGDSPASEADLRIGDSILAVDGVEYHATSDVVDAITGSQGDSTELLVVRGDNQLTLDLTPRLDPPENQGPIGVQLLETVTVRYPWYQAIWEATKQTVIMTGQIFVVFWQMITSLISTGSVGADVAGPVGIAVITGQVLERGIVPLLQFTALLSINLGIINALPFPALDGGRLLFLLIEKIRRKKVSKKVENMLHTTGFILLIALVLAVTLRDVFRFF